MTDAEKKELVRTYLELKATGKLSPNLVDPSPGALRDECLIIYQEKHGPEDDLILRTFFKKDPENEQTPGKVDIDKFRPLVTLLKHGKGNPNTKHYFLLAWLLDFQSGRDKFQEGSDETEVSNNTIKAENTEGQHAGIDNNLSLVQNGTDHSTGVEVVIEGDGKITKQASVWKVIVSIIVILFTGGGAYLYLEITKSCMYWTGDHYQSSSCAIKRGDTAVIAFDEQKAALKKITRPDTLTHHAFGRVWYIKINNGIEFYTAGGFHPIEGKKRLRPVTIYIIDKYILHK